MSGRPESPSRGRSRVGVPRQPTWGPIGERIRERIRERSAVAWGCRLALDLGSVRGRCGAEGSVRRSMRARSGGRSGIDPGSSWDRVDWSRNPAPGGDREFEVNERNSRASRNNHSQKRGRLKTWRWTSIGPAGTAKRGGPRCADAGPLRHRCSCSPRSCLLCRLLQGGFPNYT